MRISLLLLSSLFFAGHTLATKESPGPDTSTAFEDWKKKYSKSFTVEEHAYRLSIFARNLDYIHNHNNAGIHGHTLALNKWAHLTHDEWIQTVALGRKKTPGRHMKNLRTRPPTVDVDSQLDDILRQIGGTIPSSVNWTAVGGVTPVKDQGQCGSCWAFASTVATEGAHFIKNGTLLSLSEQQIVSCDTKNGNDGCNGGEQIVALDWLAKQPGQCTETAYPYKSGNGKTLKCIEGCNPTVKIEKGVELAPHNETLLMAAIAMVPLSLSVDASGNFWQFYSGGIVTEACKCDNDNCLDHGVGGVGYGTDPTSKKDYWIVKNSWGQDWGQNGYILLQRGTDFNPYGQCGVQIDNAYAVAAN